MWFLMSNVVLVQWILDILRKKASFLQSKMFACMKSYFTIKGCADFVRLFALMEMPMLCMCSIANGSSFTNIHEVTAREVNGWIWQNSGPVVLTPEKTRSPPCFLPNPGLAHLAQLQRQSQQIHLENLLEFTNLPRFFTSLSPVKR